MMHYKDKKKRPLMYVWDMMTPYGFKYKAYSNNKNMYAWDGEPRINLKKR